MKIGIVGLPNVGKSALFNALTGLAAQSRNYPFCTVDPNVGIVPVSDLRLDKLAEIYNSKKITHAAIEFVDIAGLVRGASQGEGLGNKFLANIREADAIVHVVRCFEDENIIHVNNKVDPENDIETVNLELILADISAAERQVEKAVKMIKVDKKYETELKFWEKVLFNLQKEIPARLIPLEFEEKKIMKTACLLTFKNVIYVGNVNEKAFSENIDENKYYKSVKKIADKESAVSVPICAELESQISQMSENERKEFLNDAGIKESGLNMLIKVCYKALGLISFLTAGESEVRAWTINKETKAPQAAGKIHSDMERGFIRAEVISYDDLISYGSLFSARENGKISSEGKDYIVKDGDVILFRFT